MKQAKHIIPDFDDNVHLIYDDLTPKQQKRFNHVKQIEASEALEGYSPLADEGGYAYELQKKYILGKITAVESTKLLKKYYGVK